MKIPELLHPEAIFVNLDAADSTAVITELGNRLLKLGAVKEGFVEATLAREASMPTGLPLMGEFNAALPHVDIEYVNRPALALATLTRPVIFKNMVNPDEDVPVSLVIMLALDQGWGIKGVWAGLAGLILVRLATCGERFASRRWALTGAPVQA